MAVNAVGSSSKIYQGSSSDAGVNTVQRTIDLEKKVKSTANVIENHEIDISVKDGKESKEAYDNRDNEMIKKSIEKLSRKMDNTECLFGIHEKTNRVTIKIVDKETREIVKEYPPEKTLELIAKAWEIAGILVDEKR